MSTPSQIKVWLEILQRLPTVAFFWISTNAPIFVSSPISQPYRLMNLERRTPFPSLTSGAMQTKSFKRAPQSHAQEQHSSLARIRRGSGWSDWRPQAVELHAG